MSNHLLSELKTFWNTPIPAERSNVSLSSGLKFLLFFCVFFVVVKLNDPLEEILHIFKIGLSVLCGLLVAGGAETLFLKFGRKRLVTRFGVMFLEFLAVYTLAVAMVYLLQRLLEGAIPEGWILRYYWRHLPFAILTIALFIYREYKVALVDRLVSRLNAALERTGGEVEAYAVPPAGEALAPLCFKVGAVTVPLRPDTLIAVSVNGHYLDIHYRKAGRAHYLSVRKPLGELFAELPGDLFVKIHRSHIINLSFIQRLKKVRRQYFVQLSDLETALPISRSNLPHVLARLEETA